MRELSAVAMRGSLKRLASEMEREGEPILLRVGGRPVGVLVSLRDFRERFAAKVAGEERRRLVDEILRHRKRGQRSVQRVIDGLRGR